LAKIQILNPHSPTPPPPLYFSYYKSFLSNLMNFDIHLNTQEINSDMGAIILNMIILIGQK
jgi:hypothetical protein